MPLRTIIYANDVGRALAETIGRALNPQETSIRPYASIDPAELRRIADEQEAIIYIGAVGIAIRQCAPIIRDKHTDPAVVAVDSTGRYVIPLLSGHIGGANDLARHIARITGGEAVITTQSDRTGLWPIDTLDQCMGWRAEPLEPKAMNEIVYRFVNKRPTTLYLDVRNAGTAHLERTAPEHVQILSGDVDWSSIQTDLVIAISARLLPIPEDTPCLCLRPPCLHLGVGCRKQIDPKGVADYIASEIQSFGYSPLAIADISTIELKKDEPLLATLSTALGGCGIRIFSAEELAKISVPNPSSRVKRATGVPAVSEAAAICAAGGKLLIEKQKGSLSEGNDFTFALADDPAMRRGALIEIVGAGPGDPDLISVRGRRLIEAADLILYAGSLVPKVLTEPAKAGCIVRSSEDMDLEEQFDLMLRHYKRGHLIVRLHTGDPCIYGAIQEQMAYFDRYGLTYHITPGISSFQAAAAELRSQFTIPEEVQTIILTRGEGRTAMPEREKLHLLARSRSTMCIFLSASIAEKVQEELLQEYPPDTPVAACYKLTWPDQKIFRGRLDRLAHMIRDNGLTLTTMIIVGQAIDNRHGLSRLYAAEFGHLFREAEKKK